MKYEIFFLLFFGIICGVIGCAGHNTDPASPLSAATSSADAVRLDRWLENSAFPEILKLLRTESYNQNLPIIIVKAEEETISRRIDPLTRHVRDRISTFLLKHPDVTLVLRHPVSRIERPYEIRKIGCRNYTAYKLLLTIAIQALPSAGNGSHEANIAIKAIDPEKGHFIGGFSVHHDHLLLDQQQYNALHGDAIPDQYLKGLKYLPFQETEYDRMASFLAENVVCIFNEAGIEHGTSIYLADENIHRKYKDIVIMLRKQLQRYGGLASASRKDGAEWILRPSVTGSGDARQFWIEAVQGKQQAGYGISTYAYFEYGASIVGKWNIFEITGGGNEIHSGFFEVTKADNNYYKGNLYDKSGNLVKGGLIIDHRKDQLRWRYSDVSMRYEFFGTLKDDGEEMSIERRTFPRSGRKHYKFTRYYED